MPDTWFRCLGRIREGKFRAFDSRRLDEVFRSLTGKSVEIAIREERLKRNLAQNDKINVLAREIAERSGEDFLRVKRLAVLSALGIEQGSRKEKLLGEEFTEVRGTSDLLKDEASLVLDWMVAQAAFLEVPEPNWDEVMVMD